MFETFVIVKSRAIWFAIQHETLITWRSAPLAYRLLSVVGLLALGSAAGVNGAAFARLRLLTGIVSLAALASLVVPYLTLYLATLMSEVIMAVQLAAMLLFVLATAAAVRIARLHVVSRHPSATPATRST